MMNSFYHKIDTKGQNLTKRKRKKKKARVFDNRQHRNKHREYYNPKIN